MAGKPQGASYKRSWRNYLLNLRYQLRFTGVLVAICALLMGVLGWWMDDLGRGVHKITGGAITGRWPSVMSEAESATKVGENALKGATLDFNDEKHDEQLRNAEIASLHASESHLQLFLIGAVVLLSMGLAFFGIIMTHRVAGPLYKIGLYLDKVKAGRYDKVYNLRKGDQLVEFFDHFKQAHDTLRKTQEKDVAQLKELIASAKTHDAAGKSPELRAALEELEALLKTKEAGLV